MSDYPWKHNCPNRRDTWPCVVMSRPASDHRIYVCGTEEFILMDMTTRICHPEDSVEVDMSYVNSSMYESETPLEEAERKLREYQDMSMIMQTKVDSLRRQEKFGIQPEAGSVIQFEKQYGHPGSVKYHFAAIRFDNMWYLTTSGVYHAGPMSWEKLTEFIGDGKWWKMAKVI